MDIVSYYELIIICIRYLFFQLVGHLNDLWSFSFNLNMNNEYRHKLYNETVSSYCSQSFYYLIEKQIEGDNDYFLNYSDYKIEILKEI